MTDLFLVVIVVLFIIFVVIIVIVVITFFIVRIALFFKVLGRLLLALHASLSKLLHHLEELLPIVLEKVICNGENIAYQYRIAREQGRTRPTQC
jgi:hypothetical protein